MKKEKHLALSASERIYITTELNQFKGTLDELSIVLEEIKQIVLSPEDKTAIEYKVTPDATDKTKSFVSWNPTILLDKEIIVDPFIVEYLMKRIEDKDKKGEFSGSDIVVIELRKKLKGL